MNISVRRERERTEEREGGMGECLRSCKRSVGEMGAVTEADNVGGVRMRAMDEVSSKRRRSNGSQLVNVSANLMSSSSPVSSTTSSVYTVHEQSSDVVTNGLRSTDLKQEDSETESSTFTIGEFRETSASSELCRGDTGEVMESSSTTKKKPSPKISHRKFSAAEVPSAAEIEEFFSAAEKYEQKRFTEKYNFDMVKGIPLEGRYQWVRLKP